MLEKKAYFCSLHEREREREMDPGIRYCFIFFLLAHNAHATEISSNVHPAQNKGRRLDSIPPIMTIPVINPLIPTSPNTVTTPPNTPMTFAALTPSGQRWCIAIPSASQTALQVALDYACGYGGTDCSAIQQGGSCFNPNTVRDHASYAFNNYYQKYPVDTSCNFGGTAMITTTDPSSGSCVYTSTSITTPPAIVTPPTPTTTTPIIAPPTTGNGPTIFNTTNPNGPTIFGSGTPISDSAAAINIPMILFILLICIAME